MSSQAQRSFTGGEIAPSLYARTDQSRYATGLRTCRNFVVRPHGGVTNRAGLGFVVETKTSSSVCRLLKFVFSSDQTYVLEFGALYMRVIRSGAQVTTSSVTGWITATAYVVGDLRTNGGVTYYATAAHTASAAGAVGDEPGVGDGWQFKWYAQTGTIYEIPTPYAAADLAELQYVQSADVITIVHRSYAPRELRRTGHTAWTLVTIAFTPTIGTPTTVLSASGGTAGANTYYAVTAVADDTLEEGLAGRSPARAFVPSTANPISVTWDYVSGAGEYNVYRGTDGVTYGYIGKASNAGSSVTDATWLAPVNAVATTAASGTWTASAAVLDNPCVVWTFPAKAVDGNYRVHIRARFSTTATATVLGRVHAYYRKDSGAYLSAGTMQEVGWGASGAATSGYSDYDFTVAVPDSNYQGLTIRLIAEVQKSSLTAATVTFEIDRTTPNDTIIWTAPGFSATVTFSDPGLTIDYGILPPVLISVGAAVGNYPGSVGYYQQRRLFASSTNEPEKVWASRIGSPSTFLISTPIKDDDAVVFSLSGRQVNEVRHLLDLGGLVAFTSTGAWIVEGDQAGILRPGEVNPRQVSYEGSARVPAPMLAVNTALFTQARGTVLRDLAESGQSGNDLTLFAPHLFEGYTLVDGDWTQIPLPQAYAVRSDGKLLGCSYIKEQDVLAWSRHDTDGTFERIISVPEGTEDAVYAIVNRTINGVTKRYIERFKSRYFTDIRRAVFMDSALSYDGTNATATTMTISGGTAWDYTELLTITASAAFFTAGDVGNYIFFTDSAGAVTRFALANFTSATVMTGFPDALVPVVARNSARTTWSRAADEFSGLSHLEGKAVAVLGDGYVVASPNNTDYPTITVTAGVATLLQPYAIVHIGLPYLSDLETLDIDTPSGPSVKTKRFLVNRVAFWLEQARGVFAGREFPTGSNALTGLAEYKMRDAEGYLSPITPLTDAIEVRIESTWQSTGRVVLRNVDPVPVTVLAAIPQGYHPRPR